MKALYPTLALAAFAFVACDDDSYNDWTPAQSNPDTTEDQRIAVSFSVADVDAVNFADLEDGQDSVKIFTPTLTSTGETADAISYKVLIANATDEVSVSNDGKIAVTDLRSAIEKEYGKAPTERQLPSVLVAYTTYGSVVTRETANFNIVATLTAPKIEEAYYYIGASNDWSLTDKTYKFTRADESVSVYDDPVFTCVVPAPYEKDKTTGEYVKDENGDLIRVANWFKIAPESAYELDNLWDGEILGSAIDGDESTEVNLVNENAQACMQPATDGALKYKITINMMEYTMTIEAINFAEYLYYAGDYTGWQANAQPLLGDGAGLYTGYYYIKKADNASTWGFKFTDGIGDDAKTWYGGTSDNALVKSGGDNCTPDADGFYAIKADLDKMTYSIESVSVSIIGSVVLKEDGTADTSWGTDADMTFNTETGAWEYTGKLAAGEFKFRANHDWALSWGGDADAMTSANGANIKLESDGSYKVSFKPNCDGKGVYTIASVN